MATLELTDEQAVHVRRALWDEVNCLSHAVAECVEEDAACHLHSRSLLLDVIRLLETNAMHHTPGPWHFHFAGSIAEQSDGEYGEATGITTRSEAAFFQDGDRGDLVAWVPHDGHHVANARLIAAAPELLAVVRMAIDYANDTKDRFGVNFDGDDAESYDKLMDAADAAITKAEGRSE